MACCALPGGCGDPTCYLCSVVSNLPQPEQHSDQQKKGRAELKDSAPRVGRQKTQGAA